MMRESVEHLADCLDDLVEVQERLLLALLAQRPAIIEARHRDVEQLSRRVEIEIRRLAVAERAREAATQTLAHECGLPGTRWSLLSSALDEDEVEVIGGLVATVEQLVRDIELANTINGQLVRQELEVLDISMRGLAGTGARQYTAAGATAEAPPPSPLMFNLSA